MLMYQETPIQEIEDTILSQAGVRLFIKREDLNHPFVSGNKWWKLKYNLEEALRLNHEGILTFGGAYSNHIYATAAAANELGLQSIGIIRGEQTIPLNSTLAFAKNQGMSLHYISRAAYQKKQPEDDIVKKFGKYYYIPEGGSNELAVKGVMEFASTLQMAYDYLCCPVGTGGTISGLIEGVSTKKKIVGFAILKQGEFLIPDIQRLSNASKTETNWQLMTDYHFGGYAKFTPYLKTFVQNFKSAHNISLDLVYTGKMMAGIFDLVQKDFFTRGSIILAIHTGGLQTNG